MSLPPPGTPLQPRPTTAMSSPLPLPLPPPIRWVTLHTCRRGSWPRTYHLNFDRNPAAWEAPRPHEIPPASLRRTKRQWDELAPCPYTPPRRELEEMMRSVHEVVHEMKRQLDEVRCRQDSQALLARQAASQALVATTRLLSLSI